MEMSWTVTLRESVIDDLRWFGKYRVLFNVNEEAQDVDIILVGEKRGNSLIVQGEEFAAHEGDTTE
jgi:hypothetical protein